MCHPLQKRNGGGVSVCMRVDRRFSVHLWLLLLLMSLQLWGGRESESRFPSTYEIHIISTRGIGNDMCLRVRVPLLTRGCLSLSLSTCVRL